jgi:hypothetical protein
VSTNTPARELDLEIKKAEQELLKKHRTHLLATEGQLPSKARKSFQKGEQKSPLKGISALGAIGVGV